MKSIRFSDIEPLPTPSPRGKLKSIGKVFIYIGESVPLIIISVLSIVACLACCCCANLCAEEEEPTEWRVLQPRPQINT